MIPAESTSRGVNLDEVPVEYPSVLSDGDANMIPVDEGDDISGVGVIYEDPNQFRERRRLAELLETETESWEAANEPQNVPPRPVASKSSGRSRRAGSKGGSKASGSSGTGSRRSSRAAGF